MDIYDELELLIKKSKNIIKNNSIKKAMKLISQLKNPITEERLGTKKAFKIYSNVIREKMVYNPKKHDNNIDLYFDQIKGKIEEAYIYI